MKRCISKAIFGAVVLTGSFVSAPALAQAPGQAAPPAVGGPRIAVIDLNEIFKKHERFNTAMQDLKHDVERAEEELKQKREEIRRMAEQLEEFKPGSPEFKQLEATVASRQAQISAEVQLKKKEFMQQEAKVHFQAYQEVMDEVKYYASRNQIALVMQISEEAADPNNPEAVLGELRKSVLFHDGNINITAAILDAVNRRQPAPAQTVGRGAPARGGAAPGAAPATAPAVPRTARPPQPGQPVPR